MNFHCRTFLMTQFDLIIIFNEKCSGITHFSFLRSPWYLKASDLDEDISYHKIKNNIILINFN